MSHDNELELALSRVVDRRETAADWQCIETAERNNSGVVAELIASLKADADLRTFMRGEQSAIENEDPEPTSRPAVVSRPKTKRVQRVLAHALPLLAVGFVGIWLGSVWAPDHDQPDLPSGQPSVQMDTSSEALAQYVRLAQAEGRHLSLLSDVVVGVEPREGDSKFVMTTIKRVVEQRLVDGVMKTSVDDGGRLVAMPVTPESLTAPRSF